MNLSSAVVIVELKAGSTGGVADWAGSGDSRVRGSVVLLCYYYYYYKFIIIYYLLKKGLKVKGYPTSIAIV